MAGEGIELTIAKYDSINTIYQILPNRRDPKALTEVGGVGGGSFFVSRNDPKIQDAAVLKSRNICRLKVDGQVVDAFILQDREPTLVSQGENKDRGYLVSGQGLKGWFNDASVAPYGGIKPNSMDQRYFNFASETGSWYVAGDWVNPTVLGQINVDPRWGVDRVKKWPEKAAGASWIWAAPYASPAPSDPCYFRWTVTTTDGLFAIYVTADDYFELYVDGQQLAKSNTNTSASYEAARIEIPLSSGTHTIGFMAHNIIAPGFNGPAALAAALFSVADDKTETLIGSSGSGTWKALAYPAYEPGWTAGEVMIKLLDEAQGRGVLFPTYLTKTFTATTDSKGATWADKIAWTFKVGESYSSVLAKFEDLFEVWIDPAAMTLNMAPTRGTDRSTGTSPVQFILGRDLVEAKTKARGDIKNSLMVKSLDGWTVESDSASVATFGRIEDSLDTGATKSMAKKLAALVFSSRAQEEIGATYQVISTKYKANVDYFVGDWVLAPNERGVMVPRRIVSISYEESSAGRPIPTLEFDTIFQDNETKLANAVGKLGGGGVGGSLGGSAGSTPGVGQPIELPPTTSPITLIPKAPTGLSATSSGYWSANGVNALSTVTLTWAAVTQYTDNSVLIPAYYLVERKLSSNAQGWEIVGKYYSNSAVMPAYTPGQAWDFRVSTVDDLGTSSVPSASASHTPVGPTAAMLAPTAPSLISSMGVILATWDGKLTPGPVDPPAQFRYVYAEMSTAASGQPWTRVGGSIQRGGGQIQISNQPIGSQRWVRFIAVDGAGITSPVSGTANITVTGISLGSLDPAIAAAISNAQTTADGKNTIYRSTINYTAWVETRRNVFPDPRAKALTAFGTSSATALATTTDTNGTTWAKSTRNGTGALRIFDLKTTTATTASTSYRLVIRTRASAAMTGVTIAWRPNVTSATGQTITSAFDIPAGESSIDLNLSTGSTAASSTSGFVILHTGETGIVLEITDIGIEKASTSNGEVFDGNSGSGYFFQSRWLGTADASISVYETRDAVTPTFTPTPTNGDLWFVLDSIDPTDIVQTRIYNGTTWVPYLLVAETVVATGSIIAPLIRAGTITVNELSPSVGNELVLTANGAVTTLINVQNSQASQIATTQDAAADAAAAAAAASQAAGDAQGQVTTLSGTVSSVNAAQQATQAQVNNLQTWFRVDAQGAHVGQTGSVFQTHIRPNQFDITENDVVTTYWQAGQMVVPSLVADKMKLTNFQFEAYGSGMVVRLL